MVSIKQQDEEMRFENSIFEIYFDTSMIYA